MNTLREIIKREIAEHGGILSFARFMDLALYCPQLGYYERKKDTVGRGGDYYTNVSVGPLFGELLACQFADWLEALSPQPAALHLIEAGAHDGRLAADILHWLQRQRPALLERLEYLILEPSARRRQWQQETLAAFAPRVRWENCQLSTGNPQLAGILFSNELLDAFPVHRLGWDARAQSWFEWGVAADAGQFTWGRLRTPHSALRPPQLPAGLGDVLPDGFTIETCPAAEEWWRAAAGSLARGKLVTIDYGLTAEERFTPGRNDGSLRAYHRHRVSADLLANVGEQDLTAHVDFTALRQAGEAAGWQTAGLWPQPKFLTQVAERIWQTPAAFGEWTPAHTRQFQTLVHPDLLGRGFKVLVQSR